MMLSDFIHGGGAAFIVIIMNAVLGQKSISMVQGFDCSPIPSIALSSMPSMPRTSVARSALSYNVPTTSQSKLQRHQYSCSSNGGNSNSRSSYTVGNSNSVTSTALPLYLDPSQSLVSMSDQSKYAKSQTSVNYRNNLTIEKDIIELVESIYKTNAHITKSNIPPLFLPNKEHIQQKPSYILLNGVVEKGRTMEEQKALLIAEANDADELRRRFHPSMTLLSKDGIMERHRPENGVVPYDLTSGTTSSSDRISIDERPNDNKPLQWLLDQKLHRMNNQRICFFDDEPHISLTDFEYSVTTEQIVDAANTGLCMAAIATLTLLHPLENLESMLRYGSYSLSPSFFNLKDVELASCLLISMPAVSAYASITRTTFGSLTRTMSTFWMDLLRVAFVSSRELTNICIEGTTLVRSTMLSIPPTEESDKHHNVMRGESEQLQSTTTVEDMESIKNAVEKEEAHRKDSLPSIPVLMGELVWYSSLAVFDQAKKVITKTTDDILNYQVNMIRTNRLQVQERKQRNLLKAQLYYTNRMKAKKNSLQESFCTTSIDVNNDKNIEADSIQENRMQVQERIQRNLLEAQLHYNMKGKQKAAFQQENIFSPLSVLRVDDDIGNKDETSSQVFVADPTLSNDVHCIVARSDVFGDVQNNYMQEEQNNVRDELEGARKSSIINENLFILGEEEREQQLMDDQTTIHLIGNIYNEHSLQLVEHSVIAHSEAAVPLKDNDSVVLHENLFLLGEAERDEVIASSETETLHLLGNIAYEGIAVRSDELNSYDSIAKKVSDINLPTMSLFHLGDEERDEVEASSETVQLLGNIEVGVQAENVGGKAAEDKEETEYRNSVHRLIQERARSDSKKRLQRIMSNNIQEPPKELNVDEEELMSEIDAYLTSERREQTKVKRNWKSLSHKAQKIKMYLSGSSKSKDMNRRYTLVQRISMHIMAATSIIFGSSRERTSGEDENGTAITFTSSIDEETDVFATSYR